MNDKLKIIITIIVILILIAINLIIFISNSQKKTKEATTENTTTTHNYRTMTVEQEAEKAKSDTEIIKDNKIAAMSEGDRAKAYFAKFLEAIEDKNYEKAYSYLNENYKQQYFPEIASFEEYIKTDFPTGRMVVQYNKIDRKGEIFVLSVILNDANNVQDSQKIRTIVIRETGTNQFTISFSK